MRQENEDLERIRDPDAHGHEDPDARDGKADSRILSKSSFSRLKSFPSRLGKDLGRENEDLERIRDPDAHGHQDPDARDGKARTWKGFANPFQVLAFPSRASGS